MKIIIATLVVAVTSLSSLAAAGETIGPAEKSDSGSLSSGAKEASPSTSGQGENAPVGRAYNDTSTGTATGSSNTDTVPGTTKGAGSSSDPNGVEKR